MNSNKIDSTQKQRDELNAKKEPSLQFGLSIAIGVLIILIAAGAFYSGIIH